MSQCAPVCYFKHERRAADELQPRQIEGEQYAGGVREKAVIVDVAGKLRGIQRLERAGIDENRADDRADEAENERGYFFASSHDSQPPFKT